MRDGVKALFVELILNCRLRFDAAHATPLVTIRHAILSAAP